ncbi:hypothetical protein D3C76_1113990 [compost metagenome]
MHPSGAAVDFRAGDAAQVGHLRVGVEGRLLLGDRQHRAQVALARCDALGLERLLDIPGPAFAVLGLGRQQAQQLGMHFRRVGLDFFFAPPDAALQQRQGHQARGEEPSVQGCSPTM